MPTERTPTTLPKWFMSVVLPLVGFVILGVAGVMWSVIQQNELEIKTLRAEHAKDMSSVMSRLAQDDANIGHIQEDLSEIKGMLRELRAALVTHNTSGSP